MGNPITITCSVRDINEITKKLTGNDQILIRNWSIAEATMSAKTEAGASIDNDLYIIKNGSKTEFGTTAEFRQVVSNAFVFSAADSKGRTAQETVTLSMVDYVRPTCNSNNDRIDTNGKITLTCYGEFFNGTFGAKKNELTVECRYKPEGGSWSSEYSMTITKTGNTYSASKSFTGLDYKKSYEFQFHVTDLLSEAAAETGNLSSLPVFHWGKDNVVFEVPVYLNQETYFAKAPEFDCDLQITGNLRLEGTESYGNTLNFGDEENCYITEVDEDLMNIYALNGVLLTANTVANSTSGIAAYNITLNATNKLSLRAKSFSFTENGKSAALPVYGEWTPELSIDDDVSYISCDGWYTKIGDIVTVGFYIKADCYPGTEDIVIMIENLPYAPAYSAAGGGICSGAVVSTDKNFQGFVAETDGTITLRAQECDETSGSYLSTSKSALRYPNNKELTLSGTITYMV